MGTLSKFPKTYDTVAMALGVEGESLSSSEGTAVAFLRRTVAPSLDTMPRPIPINEVRTIPVTKMVVDMPMAHEWLNWHHDKVIAFCMRRMWYGNYMEMLQQVEKFDPESDPGTFEYRVKAWQEWAKDRLYR